MEFHNFKFNDLLINLAVSYLDYLEIYMNNKYPLVCICVPTFNAEKTIFETMISIVNQTYKNIIIKVIDNASTDSTIGLVESFKDQRITIIRNEINVGGEGNFDRCIVYSEGEYTAIFHSDDIYASDIIEKQVLFLEENKSVGAAFTRAELINDDGFVFGMTYIPKYNKNVVKIYDFKEIFKETLKSMNFLVCPSAMVRTRIYREEIKYWRVELFKSSSDLDVWLRILEHHSIGILHEKLMKYRIGRNHFSASLKNRIERSDFFLVIDFYLAKENILNILTKNDIRNYRWVERASYVTQAAKLFMLSRFNEANVLCGSVLTFDAIHACFYSRLAKKALITSCSIKIFSILKMPTIGKKLIGRLS